MVFQDTTIRQTVYITQDAPTIRLQISNAFGISDLPITAVTIAVPLNGSAGTSSVKTESVKPLTFSGHADFIVPNGARVVSDPVDYPVEAEQILTISIYLAAGQSTNYITGHPGSRTTSFYAPGNRVDAADIADDAAAQHTDHWYFISNIDGWLPGASSALVIVGDSITDGRGSTTNNNDRWPDRLLARLQNDSSANNIAVVNQAAGGNRVLYDGLGPNALGRIDRDVIVQSGAKYALLYEGVNDIGMADTDAATQETVGTRLIGAYDQVISRLHTFGIPVFGATITPFSGPGQAYSDANREATRQRVNEWIRRGGRFDAVVDFDEAVRDPANATQLASAYNSGDYLHLNPEGYRVMAEAVDLSLFARFKGGVHSMT